MDRSILEVLNEWSKACLVKENEQPNHYEIEVYGKTYIIKSEEFDRAQIELNRQIRLNYSELNDVLDHIVIRYEGEFSDMLPATLTTEKIKSTANVNRKHLSDEQLKVLFMMTQPLPKLDMDDSFEDQLAVLKNDLQRRIDLAKTVI